MGIRDSGDATRTLGLSAASAAGPGADTGAGHESSGTLLRVTDLRTSFASHGESVRVVDGVDLEIRSGMTLGLVGESGSGKSVTAMSIMGLIGRAGEIEGGSSIVFEGRDLTTVSASELRALRGNRMSMIFQEPMTSLNPVMRVGHQVAEALRLHHDVSWNDAKSRAVEMLDRVGIPSPASRSRDYPHELSGGMRQRVMIAMALMCSPRLLIADEPTTALDITIQAQILSLLSELRTGTDMSMLLITHDLGVVSSMAEEIAVMYAGQVVERGATSAVLRAPQHPYTQALIRSVPKLRRGGSEPLQAISGTVPSAGSWPRGCRFAGRCEFAFERCRVEAPPMFRVGQQQSACWLREPNESAPPAALDRS